MFELKDKVAVITGGSSGIGRAISEVFSQQGAKVNILDVNEKAGAALAKQLGSNARYWHCDVSQQSEVKASVDSIIGQWKKIDILINNAGISNIGQAHTTEEGDFDKVFAVNVKGVYNCLHVTLPHMTEMGGGVILNMSSVAAVLGIADRFAYSMSKGAVQSMTFSVAKDYIDQGIRCNAIGPGRVHTPFVDGYLAKNYPGQEKEMFEKLSRTQPIGRMGSPSEIAKLALYLCSDEASFVTGAFYPIDGGFVTLNT